MSDNGKNNKELKATVKEITIELPVNNGKKVDVESQKDIRPKKKKTTPVKDESFVGEVKNMASSIFSKERVESIKETVKIGTDVVKNYKDDFGKKSEHPDFVPNKVELKDNKDSASKKSGIEIEVGDLSKKAEGISNNQQGYEADKWKDIENKSTVDTKSTKDTKGVKGSKGTSNKSKPSGNTNRKRPSNSLSSKAGAFIGLFETQDSKKGIVSDKDFQKLVAIAVILLMIFGGVWYGFRYFLTDDMAEVSPVSKDISATYPGLIKPSTLLVERIPDVIDMLGVPKASGTIDGTANEFVEYEGKWFGEDALTKIVYGPDSRVYFADIDYISASVEKIYQTMVTYLGNPVVNKLSEEANEAQWFVDSTLFLLSDENGKAKLSLQTPIYNNANNYPIAEGAIVVEKQGGYDLTGDGENDVVVMIGEKESYFYKDYSKFHITLWDGQNVFYSDFPSGTDGGRNPILTFGDVNGDTVTDITVETQNNAIKNYNSFTARTGNMSVIYSGHEKK